MKGRKMRRIFLFALCFATVISITSAINPVDEVDITEEEEVARPIRASTSSSDSTRKRRGRNGRVQKRRLQSHRATRAPLFEASPPDPFIDNGLNGGDIDQSTHYGHSHSPPTRDPYYSPSKFERERKRKKARVVNDGVSYEEGSPDYKPGKNYAFAYAVGDESEDFSHKQAKEGAITIGEYRITLPDGRTQVVRYTAGGKHGYKADVTYEPPNSNHQAKAHAPPPAPVQSTGHHHQYHASIQPTHHLSASPSPSYNSNRVYKSRPLKTTNLQHHHHQHNDEVEYSPNSSDDDEIEYHQPPPPKPSPKIRLKAEGRLPHPPPTAAHFLNSVSTTATPRPNSIYDKISPYRNGGNKYSGSDELAYAHEQSPRAGPSRGKVKKAKELGPTIATYYDSPVSSPQPQAPRKVHITPTKKYKEAIQPYYVNGAAAHHQPQTHNQFVRPPKHSQYLQETPIHHQSSPFGTKPVKEPVHHVVPYDTPAKHEPLPVAPHISYTPQPVIVSKPRKVKKLKHGIHQPLGQYLLPAPVTAQTPLSPQNHVTTYPSGPYQYYNSFHEPHHHGFAPSPTPLTSVRHSESPLPNAYPVTAFPSGGGSIGHVHEYPRIRLPTPPSQSGHVYLETPASGERPNRLGIKEALSRLPINDLPTPKTTIHPYEIGSADYGKSVAYGNSKGRGKGYPEAGYSPFPTGANGGIDSFDHLDPTNSIYTSPSGGSLTGLSGSGGGNTGTGQDIGYYQNDVDHFNFLDELQNYDIEQANVREIRQPRPTRSGRNTNSQFNPRRVRRPAPDKRRGAPLQSSEENGNKSQAPRLRVRKTTPPPSESEEQPTVPYGTRNRGRRRRVRTQQPDPMMHAVESRRTRPTSDNRNHNRRN